MKIKFLIVIQLFLIETMVSAQWVQKISGTTNALYDIHFPMADTGYAVGYYGTILKSNDAGDSWSTLSISTVSNLNAVYFLNPSTGFVAGDSGIFKTSDGGNNWNQISIPVSVILSDIKFIDNLTGFCGGANGTILKTTDGGNTWTVKPTGSGRYLRSINFPVPDTGYCVATGYNWEFLKTTDGGDTWSIIPINPNNNLSDLEAVFFTDANTGYIGGWYLSAFIKTTDGGNSWMNLDTLGSVQLYSIYFPSPAIGYAVGWNNAVGIVNTVDSGKTSHMQNSGQGITGIFYTVYFTNNTTGYIVGTDGIILKTTNGGVTGISDVQSNAEDIKIYPNPSDDFISVQNKSNSKNLSVKLFDITGKSLLEKIISEKIYIQIPVKNLEAGMYLISVSDDKKIFRQKIMVQH